MPADLDLSKTKHTGYRLTSGLLSKYCKRRLFEGIHFRGLIEKDKSWGTKIRESVAHRGSLNRFYWSGSDGYKHYRWQRLLALLDYPTGRAWWNSFWIKLLLDTMHTEATVALRRADTKNLSRVSSSRSRLLRVPDSALKLPSSLNSSRENLSWTNWFWTYYETCFLWLCDGVISYSG